MSFSSLIHLPESKWRREISVKRAYLLFLLALLFLIAISLFLNYPSRSLTTQALASKHAFRGVSSVTVNGRTVELSDPINYSHTFTSRGSNVSVSVYSHNTSSGNSSASSQSTVVVNTN